MLAYIDKEVNNSNYQTIANNIQYEYDNIGNIVKKQFIIEYNVESTSLYQYDKLGRLIKEVHPNGNVETFTYDQNSNILTHKLESPDGLPIDDETYHYSSTIKDQLISITDEYEDLYKGNPTTIINNGVSKTLTWEGRKLTQIGDIHFTYNEDGIRTRKQGTDFIEYYALEGNRIIKLHRSYESGSYDMYFNYDEQGEIIGLSRERQEINNKLFLQILIF